MTSVLLKVAVAALLPAMALLGGGWLMSLLTGHHEVENRLLGAAARCDQTPLNSRLHYDHAAVERFWTVLEGPPLNAERRFLEADLVFPLVYGAALLLALLITWIASNRPVSPAFLVLPVAIAVLSDWIENLVQLDQLGSFVKNGPMALNEAWIQIASTATFLKLCFFALSYCLVIALAVLATVRAIKVS